MSLSIAVPQTDPKAGYVAHQAPIDHAVQRVLESGWYILGREVEAFEAEFAAYIGVNHAIGVGNGTDALALCLRACGVGPNDLVFTVSHTAVATVAAIELVGATPVLVDVDPVTYTMSADSLQAALENSPAGNPKAVIPVHLYGHPADLQAIGQVARQYGLYLIEDCAQSHGAQLTGSEAGRTSGRMTGAWGDIAAFSFYPTKNLGALGDGGMVVTDNAALAEQVRLLQQYGWRQRYISDIAGGNSRLDELQAAILRVKLSVLDAENAKRREIALRYHAQLANVKGLSLPQALPNVSHVYHQYVVQSTQRDALRAYLRQENIGTLIHYPAPVHVQPAYQDRLTLPVALTTTEQISSQILSLPMFPQLTDEQIERVCGEIMRFYGE
jgi:dTDP-4-amino-4,6-dideoxygalactose transaminase